MNVNVLAAVGLGAVVVLSAIGAADADMPSKDTGWCTDRQGNAVRCSGGGVGGSRGGGRLPAPQGPTREELGARAYNEGVAHYRAGRWTDAEAAFRKATELLPGDADSHHALGAALERQVTADRWQRALNLVRKNPHWSTQEDELLRAAVDAYTKAQKLGKASAADIERVRALLAEYEAALAEGRKAQAVRDTGWKEHSEGRRLGDEARWKEAEEHFRRATRILAYDFQPNAQNPYYMLAVSLQNQNKLAEAVAAYEDLLRHEPTHARAREWLAFTRAALAERGGDFRAAETYARQAIAINANNAAAHAKLGWALYKQQRPAEAEQALREAVRLTPSVVSRRQDLARVLAAQSKTAEAERELREALRVNPANAETRQLLETLLVNHASRARALNNDAEAERVLRRLLADVPPSASARAALADVILTRADMAGDRQAADAERLYREVIALAPGHARAHNNLGVLLQGQGKLAAAESAYREAIRLEPGQDQAYRNLAVVLEQQGRRQEAVDVYQALARAKPGDAAVQRAIGADTQGRVTRLLNALTPFPGNAAAGADGGAAAAGRAAPTGSTKNQLASAAGHAGAIALGLGGPVAATEGLVAEARSAFDLPPTRRGEVAVPVLQGMARFRDPVIPERLRGDPATTQLVEKRDAAKQNVLKLDQELTALDREPRTPEGDVRVVRARQAVSDAEQRVHVYNSAIRQIVDLSFTAPPATPGEGASAAEPARKQ